MRDPELRQQQVGGLRAPHIAPVNALVDEVTDPSGRGWVPCVAPAYGGMDARAVSSARPRTGDPVTKRRVRRRRDQPRRPGNE